MSLILSLATLSFAVGGEITTPAPESAIRKEILDGFRPDVERHCGIRVKFKVNMIHRMDRWAFVLADPIKANGQAIDWSKTKRRKEYQQGKGVWFNGEVAGLLRQVGTKWRVVDYYQGMSDVPWSTKDKQHGLPPKLFGL